MDSFTLPKLTYTYDALLPYIDARTMEIHHTKHHQGYVNKLNAALKEAEKKHSTDIVTLLSQIEDYSTAVRNNAGGHYNHTLFWEALTPNAKKEPEGVFKSAIKRDFGSFTAFQEKFNQVASQLFGSGWAWLCVNSQGLLHVQATPNQDNPLMPSYKEYGMPILGLDVWEHAYYLQYQNRRPEYVDAFWHIINWAIIEERYVQALTHIYEL